MAETYPLMAPAIVLPSGTAPPPADLPATGHPDRDWDVIYAGKLERRKGLEPMLAAMSHLPGVRLHVIGGNEMERQAVSQAVAGHGLTAQVDLVGYVAPREVRTYFGRARVGLCPLPAGVSEVSERFTSPMKILEMMACGTPVVATDLPSVREILTHEHNALLVPPDDPPALALAIRRLLDDAALAGRLADQAARDAIAFAWPARARKLLTFAQEAIERRARPKSSP